MDVDYFTNKGKPCDWCEFKQEDFGSGTELILCFYISYIFIYNIKGERLWQIQNLQQ